MGTFYWVGLTDERTGHWEWVNQTPYVMNRRWDVLSFFLHSDSQRSAVETLCRLWVSDTAGGAERMNCGHWYWYWYRLVGCVVGLDKQAKAKKLSEKRISLCLFA